MKRLMSIVLVYLGFFLASAAFAAVPGRGNADEAVAMVKRAIQFAKLNGRERALAEFSDPKGQFVDRDLYVLVFDLNGVNLAHGNNPKIIGKNLIDMRDAEGKEIIRNFISIANSKGSGWFRYKWPNPITKEIETKATYIEKSDELMYGVGIFSK